MPKKPREYWLHITPSGEEVVYDAPPSDESIKTLTIWIVGRWEHTKTRNIRVGSAETLLRVRPRAGVGRDWEMYDIYDDDGVSTTWRRRRAK
jgi:hypothetical protein